MQETARIGDWMQTATGKKFWPLDPRAEEVDLQDIAHALSHQCRFAGHVAIPYTVGQHSVIIASMLAQQGYNENTQALGLMHDASEAYLVDLPRPVKYNVVGYDELEEKLTNVILDFFDIKPTPEDWLAVKAADDSLCMTEARDLMGDPQDWALKAKPAEFYVIPWHPMAIYPQFMSYANELGLLDIQLDKRRNYV